MNQAGLDAELANHLDWLSMNQDVVQGHPTVAHTQEIKTTPMFSWGVKIHMDTLSGHAYSDTRFFVFYALLGVQVPKILPSEASENQVASQDVQGSGDTSNQLMSVDQTPPAMLEPLLLNTNAPWSIFICGSSGSGKSHTLCCILEGCLLRKVPFVMNALNPMSGIVFHYGDGTTGSISEAAYLSSHIPVRVICTPTNYHAMVQKYAQFAPPMYKNIQVYPLFFGDRHLSASRTMRLLAAAIEGGEDGIEEVMEELFRDVEVELAVKGDGETTFSFDKVRADFVITYLEKVKIGPATQRLKFLANFMEDGELFRSLPRTITDVFHTPPGELVIVDLTDPSISASGACMIFDLYLSLLLEHGRAPRVLAIDNAGNLLGNSAGSKVLTDHLSQVVRDQLHTGTRLVVSSQDPAIPHQLAEICSMVFVHRITSPRYLPALQSLFSWYRPNTEEPRAEHIEPISQHVINLPAGEAVVLAPSALTEVVDNQPQRLGMNYMQVRIRPRMTENGGAAALMSDLRPGYQPQRSYTPT